MAAYAVAHLTDVSMGPDVVAYLEGIDGTLRPYGGRFLIHGGRVERLEGRWSGDLIVIEFPSLALARQWYASPAYQAILPLRLRHAKGLAFLVDGVPADHRATDVLAPAAG
ncbi:DUF1330 domain-containing protein [Aquincola sp. MAHUQ-54]|uniref:DUF1330 domain-containing protein n=1 Tax=Aquincola agrisoli TaxID=3119538 RepID=A0AAW9QPP6_9BURK